MYTDYKTIPNYPEYAVTVDGRVFSVSLNWRGYGARELKQYPDPDGYLRVRLIKNKKRVYFGVHTLVATVFLGDKPTKNHEVRHLDGDKNHNHYQNLAWGTKKENADDRERHGRTSRGEKHAEKIKRGLERIGKNVNQ